jgi:hypothetical protein
MEQTFVYHISAPHIKSDVFALGYPVRRFMYATSEIYMQYCKAAGIVKVQAISCQSGVPPRRIEPNVRLTVCESGVRPRDCQQRAGQQRGGNVESPLYEVLISVNDPYTQHRSR